MLLNNSTAIHHTKTAHKTNVVALTTERIQYCKVRLSCDSDFGMQLNWYPVIHTESRCTIRCSLAHVSGSNLKL